MEKKKANKFQTRWEFMFMLNDNIICQRYFDVRGYNKNSHLTHQFKEVFTDITDDIANLLKDKTLANMDGESHKYYSIMNYNEGMGNDNFYFIVSVDGRPVMQQIMDANIYPNSVRTNVDLRPIIPTIISRLQVSMSTKKDLEFFPEIVTPYDEFYK